MTKQYRYIWGDPKKKGWIAKEKWWMYQIIIPWFFWSSVMRELIEDEPLMWEKVKEDNIYNLYMVVWWGCELDRFKEEIKKHMWVTKMEIEKTTIHLKKVFYYERVSVLNELLQKLFSDRWLLID